MHNPHFPKPTEKMRDAAFARAMSTIRSNMTVSPRDMELMRRGDRYEFETALRMFKEAKVREREERQRHEAEERAAALEEAIDERVKVLTKEITAEVIEILNDPIKEHLFKLTDDCHDVEGSE